MSTPVNARTSAVLPWSIWPAVARIMRRAPRSSSSCARKPASSSRQRRSSTTLPPHMADHRDRQCAQGARQALRRGAGSLAVGAGPAPRSATATTGKAPLPIWLRVSTTTDFGDAGERLRDRGQQRRASASISAVGRASRRNVGSRSARRSGSA